MSGATTEAPATAPADVPAGMPVGIRVEATALGVLLHVRGVGAVCIAPEHAADLACRLWDAAGPSFITLKLTTTGARP